MRSLTSAVAVLLATGGLAACGSVDVNTDKVDDDVRQLRDQADKALDDVRSGAPAKELRQQLRGVQRDLKRKDLDDQGRQELEKARDELRDALK